jgi:aspartate/methionine/tyrosine aminotransferase
MVEPEGSMYILFRHHERTDDDAMLVALKKGVGVASGSMFFKSKGNDTGYIRVHVGLEEKEVDLICQKLECPKSL